MDFGEAIRALKAGSRVARAGWNGKGMWLVLVAPMKLAPHVAERASGGPTYALRVPLREEATPAWAAARLAAARREDPNAKLELVDWKGDDELLPFIAMFTVDKKFVPWLASQTDVLAEDWEIVP